MIKDSNKNQTTLDPMTCDELINELEKSTTDEIRKQRAYLRYTIKLPIILQPGNASQMREYKAHGMTRDISSGGLGALFSIPIGVGDIYRLDFKEAHVDLPVIMARCLSCTYVRDGTFSVGFKFFSTIHIPENLTSVNSD